LEQLAVLWGWAVMELRWSSLKALGVLLEVLAVSLEILTILLPLLLGMALLISRSLPRKSATKSRRRTSHMHVLKTLATVHDWLGHWARATLKVLLVRYLF
jgi:hypothetical protein